jgi:SAM-dependent methyltransferase
MQSSHGIQPPSAWVVRWTPLVRAGSAVLDLACGYGRHARHFASRGCRVLAVDRDAAALATLAGVPGVVTQAADLEGAAWPFASMSFDAVVVANYLHRPLFGPIIAALRPAGIFVYDTFMVGNERFGRPSNPDFLLRPGELLDVVRGHLEVVAFEQGQVETPKPAVVQRVCAVRGPAGGLTIG